MNERERDRVRMERKHGEHFVLFPFLAHGHITPFLSLADLILRRRPSAAVTLATTPLNAHALRSSLPPSSALRLHALPFSPADHGLPPAAETTNALPFHLFVKLFRASEHLRPPLLQLLADIAAEDGRQPSCIIADNFFGWTVDVARDLGLSHAVFITSGAYGSAVYNSLWRHLPHRSTDADEFPLLPDFPEITVRRSGLPKHLLAADGTDEWSLVLRGHMDLCSHSDAVLINTVEEFETTGLAMLRKTMHVPVYPVGPLLGLAPAVGDRRCAAWLDGQAPRSVLYISFGSQNTITERQMMELAAGVEASGRPFIWVVRPPVGFDVRGEFRAEWLPEGFEASGRGLVVRGWAPQGEILAHGATGAFLSHCGWNSVLESLSHGVPIIGWPFSGDQLYNSTALEREAGVCVELARTNTERAGVDRTKVEQVVGMVMGDTEKGKEMRQRAGEVAEMLRRAWKEEDGGEVGSSARGLADFFRAVLSVSAQRQIREEA